MKKIEAIIRKTKFEEVKDSLLEADIEWFSYYDVRGIGKSRQARIYRGVLYDTVPSNVSSSLSLYAIKRRKDSTSYHQSRTNRRNRRRPHLRHPH